MNEKTKCCTDIKVIHSFLNATGGNWREAIYVECSVCKHNHGSICDDFLVTFDPTAAPVILPVRDAEILFGRYIDKSECADVLCNATFLSIYSKYVKVKTVGYDGCPMMALWLVANEKEEW